MNVEQLDRRGGAIAINEQIRYLRYPRDDGGDGCSAMTRGSSTLNNVSWIPIDKEPSETLLKPKRVWRLVVAYTDERWCQLGKARESTHNVSDRSIGGLHRTFVSGHVASSSTLSPQLASNAPAHIA